MDTKQIKLLYNHNKSQSVGTDCACPICLRKFKKVQWQQAFCCPNCKETFWNKKGDRHKNDVKNYISC